MQATPISLATTLGISVDFFSCGYLDVSVHRVRSTHPIVTGKRLDCGSEALEFKPVGGVESVSEGLEPAWTSTKGSDLRDCLKSKVPRSPVTALADSGTLNSKPGEEKTGFRLGGRIDSDSGLGDSRSC